MSIKETIELNGKSIEIETGKMAKQADGAVTVKCEGTMVVVTAVSSTQLMKEQDWFPLSVHYTEKAYAAGKVPGGFFKREAKPGSKEVLTCRLIDRPIRPLFPDDYKNEVQITAIAISADQENTPDLLAMIGASAALNISDIPFKKITGSVRIGRIDGQFIVNPTFSQIAESDIELVVSASKDAILMVEGSSQEASEKDLLEAINLAHENIKKIVEAQERLVQASGKPKRKYTPYTTNADLVQSIKDKALADLEKILRTKDKRERSKLHSSFVSNLLEQEDAEKYGISEKELSIQVNHGVDEAERELIRTSIRDKKERIDGRKLDEIRPISIETGILPRAHGSTLFTRGQTQSLGITTLGTEKDRQRFDDLEGEYTEYFMLHYNFPSFSVGECGRVGFTNRREIGHGMLAQRSLSRVLPSQEKFPYVIRLVSEVMESNGSSSMATICSGTLSMMDAGVPLKRPVAGIAMGLIKEDKDFFILSDIAGEEDHHGDMDFKVAGTTNGITGFQMDIKVDGLSMEIMEKALEQARQGRLFILDKMTAVMDKPNDEVSPYAPRIVSITINPEKISEVIGSGGSMIRSIIERTSTDINIEDDGSIKIGGKDADGVAKAQEIIHEIISDPEQGKTYEGTVKRIMDFGAIVEFMGNKSGMIHISRLADHRVAKVEDVVNLGDEVTVKVERIEFDRGRPKISLSLISKKEA